MHPMIKPALRRAWRDRNTLQYGMTPAHAVLLEPVDAATGGHIDLFDGTRSLPQLEQAARRRGSARAPRGGWRSGWRLPDCSTTPRRTGGMRLWWTTGCARTWRRCR